MLSFKQFILETAKIIPFLKKAPDDHVKKWMNGNIANDEGSSVTKDKAYDHYKNWSENSGTKPVSSEDFHRTISSDHKPVKIAGATRYLSIKLKDN